MLKSMKNQMLFLGEFFRKFETTGSIIPSSRFLAKAITRYLAQRSEEPVRVLECGPGTGPFTNEIVRYLRPGDQFDLVELNSSFVQALHKRFETEPSWQQVQSQSTIYEQPLQDCEGLGDYDFIISGLPLVNFQPGLVEEIMEQYLTLLKPDGTLSYFEYMFIRPLRSRLVPGKAGQRVRDVNEVLEKRLRIHRIARDNVFLNTPPAWVQHLTRQGETRTDV